MLEDSVFRSSSESSVSIYIHLWELSESMQKTILQEDQHYEKFARWMPDDVPMMVWVDSEWILLVDRADGGEFSPKPPFSSRSSWCKPDVRTECGWFEAFKQIMWILNAEVAMARDITPGLWLHMLRPKGWTAWAVIDFASMVSSSQHAAVFWYMSLALYYQLSTYIQINSCSLCVQLLNTLHNITSKSWDSQRSRLHVQASGRECHGGVRLRLERAP